MTDTLKISEHFFSVQGEGHLSTGVPAYFVRLTDCNLSCGASQKQLNQVRKGNLVIHTNDQWHGDLHENTEASWTCDSIAVWLKGKEIAFEYLVSQWRNQLIYKDILSGLVHVIWTGGEPTLPKHQKDIVAFINWLQNESSYERNVFYNPYYEIETNGTICLTHELFSKLQQINCSPKLSNSGMSLQKRIVANALESIMAHPRYQFKFVISNESDIQEMFDTFIEPFKIPLNRVCCMPALDDREQYHKMSHFICEMAKKYKFIAQQRLHISAWGAVTGV